MKVLTILCCVVMVMAIVTLVVNSCAAGKLIQAQEVFMAKAKTNLELHERRSELLKEMIKSHEEYERSCEDLIATLDEGIELLEDGILQAEGNPEKFKALIAQVKENRKTKEELQKKIQEMQKKIQERLEKRVD